MMLYIAYYAYFYSFFLYTRTIVDIDDADALHIRFRVGAMPPPSEEVIEMTTPE